MTAVDEIQIQKFYTKVFELAEELGNDAIKADVKHSAVKACGSIFIVAEGVDKRYIKRYFHTRADLIEVSVPSANYDSIHAYAEAFLVTVRAVGIAAYSRIAYN